MLITKNRLFGPRTVSSRDLVLIDALSKALRGERLQRTFTREVPFDPRYRDADYALAWAAFSKRER